MDQTEEYYTTQVLPGLMVSQLTTQLREFIGVDAFRDMIEYSNVDGSGRFLLLSNLDHPFSITLEGNLLFWTDWLTNAIHATHKISSTGASFVYNNLRDRPFGIEAVTPTRQAQNSEWLSPPFSFLFLCLLSLS